MFIPSLPVLPASAESPPLLPIAQAAESGPRCQLRVKPESCFTSCICLYLSRITLYAFDVSFITGEKGRSFRWVVSGRQGKLASAPVYRCLRFLGLKGAHCFLRRRSCKHSLICEVVEELLHGVGETVHPAPKVVKRRTIWSTAALIFGPSCTLGRAGFS